MTSKRLQHTETLDFCLDNLKCVDCSRLSVRDALIVNYRGLVLDIAREYQGLGLPVEDLVSEGWLGLIHAVDNASPTQQAQFGTYAARCIRGSILDALNRDGHLIRADSNDELLLQVISYDVPVGDEEEQTLVDLLPGEVLTDIPFKRAERSLKKKVARMSPLFQQIIHMLEEGLSENDIARRLRLTQPRVAQIKRQLRTML